MTVNVCGVSFLDDENVLELTNSNGYTALETTELYTLNG